MEILVYENRLSDLVQSFIVRRQEIVHQTNGRLDILYTQ